MEYQDQLKALNAVAHPLASEKLNKRILKLVKKAGKASCVKRGVKETVKGLRKQAKGFVVIAGDISPIDVITHIPVLCEDNDIPYVYVPSKDDLGAMGATKRPTSCVMVVVNKDAEYKELYDQVYEQVAVLNEKLIVK
jgi:H/ACA ribonucleoprotein complex subunit 2